MKILHFVGVCGFAFNALAQETRFGKGVWDDEMIVSKTEEGQPEDITIGLPLPFELMLKGVLVKVPNFPTEGINEIEGWSLCDEIEEGEKMVKDFSEQFGKIHNQPKVDPFLKFLDELAGLFDELALLSKLEEAAKVDKPEEMTQGHETEG